MTLRELLTETGFDPMVPFIRKSECADNVCYFKLAYDILLHTSPNEEGYEYVAVSIYKSPEGKIYYNAPQLEGCIWSSYIDGEVIFIHGNVDVCQADLAYQLLDQLTFYGYSDKYSTNLFGDEHYNNKYSWMAREVEHKRDMAWATNAVRRRARASFKENKPKGLNPYEISVEDWLEIYKRQRSGRRNRMKRKRDYRWGKRLEKLGELECRENPIYELLCGQTSSVTRKDLLFLWDANKRLVSDFQTMACDVNKRLTYLDELITKYDALKHLRQVKKCVVKISTSSKYPLSGEEINCIRAMVSPCIADDNPLVMQGVDESLESEIGIYIIGVESME